MDTRGEPVNGTEGLRNQRASRRAFLKLIAFGAGGVASTALLAACGGTPPEITVPAPSSTTAQGAAKAPTAAATTASTQASSGAATSATTAVSASASVKSGGTLQLGVADIGTLNPFVSNTIVENYLLMLLYPALATLDKDSNRVPYAAESWVTSADGLTHTIKMRKGFLWEDGQPLTAKDLKFTAEFEKKNKFSWKAGLLDAVASMETPDDYTLVVKMTDPVGTFLTDFTFWFRIMPQHIWESVADPKTFPNDKPVGAGPFSLSQWKKSQFIEFKARKDYSFPPVGRPPYVDTVLYRIYPDVNTLVLAFQNGDIDAVPSGLPYDTAETVKANPDFEVIHNPSTGYNHVSFNVAGNKYLADVKVRQALAMAVDKAAIVKLVLKGYGGTMTTTVSPVLKDWVDSTLKDWPFDIEGARNS